MRRPQLTAARRSNCGVFPLILGVTGPIGCGKSTVLELFVAAAWRTADADAICRSLYDDPAGEFAAACRER
ncbi:MAG: dephospho-CoA kinase, partial [Lentisphaeria bacterium]|nr:dephospho-CoA kinase [Lentisphaeria bacterium]